MLEDNKEITLTWNESIKILKEIEYTLISLHKIGSYYFDKNIEEYRKETTRFIDEKKVTQRLAKIREILTEKFDLSPGSDDMDDLERELVKIDCWSKPGD